MGLGILEPKASTGKVSGTVQLIQDDNPNDVFLSPRPSNDPNDPLVRLHIVIKPEPKF